jgi:hypothetical protein
VHGRRRQGSCAQPPARSRRGRRRPSTLQSPEQALARALKRQLGPDGAARVLDQVRASDHANLIQAVEALRASSN